MKPQPLQPSIPQFTPPVKYAKFWERALAITMDSIILGLCGALIGALIGILYFVARGSSETSSTAASKLGIVGQSVGSILNWLYFTCYECSENQATPGKQIMGIQVTNLRGERLSFGQANGRYFSKIISTITLGFGFLMPLFDDKKQALHDKVSGCLAIKK